MASWNEILDRFGHMPSQYDLVRREYLKQLSDYTGRNTILYYSAWLQKSLMANGTFDFGINDNDKTGFMTCIYQLDKTKGLDLILHTPGGDISGYGIFGSISSKHLWKRYSCYYPSNGYVCRYYDFLQCKRDNHGKTFKLGTYRSAVRNV